MITPTTSPELARLLRGFFCQRLIAQRRASTQTVSAYRDAFRLLLRFAQSRLGKPAAALSLCDLDAPLILAFLDDLEVHRHNSIRRRNARLAAIRAFLHYAALEEPAALPVIQQVLAIPMERFERPLVGFLSLEEIEAILQAPDAHTWSGRRDRALLTTLYNTGARVSEIIAVRRVDLERGQALLLHGKGRKERVVPLWKRTVNTARMAAPDRPRGATTALPESLPTGHDTRRRRVAAASVNVHGGPSVPLASSEAGIAAHCEAHNGNASAPIRGGPDGNRPVVGPRERGNHPPISRSRH